MTFTWIPFYKELAQELLQYRDNRQPIIDWIYDNLHGYIGHLKDDSDGHRVSDLDPFSVFAIFNRSITDNRQKDICAKFKEFVGLSAAVPDDFNGIPVMNTKRTNFMAFADRREDGDINRLWDVFADAVSDKDIADSYDALSNQFLIKFNLTIGLFWIRPDRFLPLDGNCQAYLKSLGINFDSRFFPAV